MNCQSFCAGFFARCHRGLVFAILGLSLGTGVQANQADTEMVHGPSSAAQPPIAAETPTGMQPPGRIDPLASLQALSRYLTPADMLELSRFMFEVVMDLFRGTQQATLPPDLSFKLAVLEQRFKKEGDAYMQQVLRDLERDLRRFVKERLPFLQLPPLKQGDGR